MTYILFGIEQNLLQNHSVTGTAWESQAIELEFLATTPSNNETPELPHRTTLGPAKTNTTAGDKSLRFDGSVTNQH